MPVMLPPPGESSLMLDLDGTLLDIAAARRNCGILLSMYQP